MPREAAPPRPALLIAPLVLVHAAIRLWGLGAPSLWWDESFTWYASSSLRTVVERVTADVHPPAFFAFLVGWRALFGESELALRLPAVIFSCLALLGVLALVRRVSGDGALPTVAAGLFLALLPLEIHLARFARNYSLALALEAAFAYWALRYAIDDHRRSLAPAIGAGILALYSHHLALIYVPATLAAGVLAMPTRARVRSAVAVGGPIALAYLPWLPRLRTQLDEKAGMIHLHRLSELDLQSLLTPVNPFPVRAVFSSIPPGRLGALGVGLALALAAIALARAPQTWRSAWGRALTLQGALAFALMALSPTPLFNDRNVVIFVPTLAVLLADVFSPAPDRRRRVAQLAAAAIILSPIVALPHANLFPDWRGAIAQAHERGWLAPGVPLFVASPWDGLTLRYYASRGELDLAALRQLDTPSLAELAAKLPSAPGSSAVAVIEEPWSLDAPSPAPGLRIERVALAHLTLVHLSRE